MLSAKVPSSRNLYCYIAEFEPLVEHVLKNNKVSGYVFVGEGFEMLNLSVPNRSSHGEFVFVDFLKKIYE